MAVEIEIPPLSYFESGNPFTGSKNQSFRFRVAKQEDELQAFIWRQDICFELAENKEENHFPLTADGLSSCRAWLNEQAEKNV